MFTFFLDIYTHSLNAAYSEPLVDFLNHCNGNHDPDWYYQYIQLTKGQHLGPVLLYVPIDASEWFEDELNQQLFAYIYEPGVKDAFRWDDKKQIPFIFLEGKFHPIEQNSPLFKDFKPYQKS